MSVGTLAAVRAIGSLDAVGVPFVDAVESSVGCAVPEGIDVRRANHDEDPIHDGNADQHRVHDATEAPAASSVGSTEVLERLDRILALLEANRRADASTSTRT